MFANLKITDSDKQTISRNKAKGRDGMADLIAFSPDRGLAWRITWIRILIIVERALPSRTIENFTKSQWLCTAGVNGKTFGLKLLA